MGEGVVMQLTEKDDFVLARNFGHGFESDFISLIVVDFIGQCLGRCQYRKKETNDREADFLIHNLGDIAR